MTSNDDRPLGQSEKGGIVGHLRSQTRGFAGQVALVGNRSCRFDSLTYEALDDLVDRFAAGLLDLGVDAGAHVGLISENRDTWLIASLGVISLGAVDVPRGGDAPADEVQFCLSHADCQAVILESPEQLEKIGPLSASLSPVILLSGEAPGAISFDDVLERGSARLAKEPSAVSDRRQAVDGTTLCTIIYTSGTTGNPKGVMLTHGNILHNIRTVPPVLGFSQGQRFLSFLPSWHSFERTVEYVVLSQGVTIHYSSKRTLRQDLIRVRPNFIGAVPRVYEVIVNGTLAKLESLTGFRKTLVALSLEGSKQAVTAWRTLTRQCVDERGVVPDPNILERLGLLIIALFCWPAHLLAKVLVYSKVKEAFGGQIALAISGGGPLPLRVDEFLTRAGISLRNGYGLTETSPVVAVRLASPNRVGTIGPPVPETEIVAFSSDGEPLQNGTIGTLKIRGPQVMRGYYANESATRAAIDKDHWFDTGDQGLITSLGDVVITGRAKDTIVLSGGENIEPERIEAHLTANPLIDDAVLVGHGQKALGVLIVPNRDALALRLSDPLPADDAALASHEGVFRLIRDAVSDSVSRTRGFRSYEQITQVALLPKPLSPEDGTLTMTLKKKRSVIEERYRDVILELFR